MHAEMDSLQQSEQLPARDRLKEVALLFLRLGFTAFGGPAAHISLMEDWVITRRKWLDRQHFLDLISAINFIPGPNSTELAITLGGVRAGLPGLIVAGVCFIGPAMLIILPIAAMYMMYGQRDFMQPLFHSANTAVLAVVVVALWRFAKTGITSTFALAVAIGAMSMEFVFLRWLPKIAPEVPVLICSALAGFLRSRWQDWRKQTSTTVLTIAPLFTVMTEPDLWRMAGIFLKIGGTLFGSGYVLMSYLQSDFLDTHHWLTQRELLDALVVGQFTPGPVLTTATFVGFVIGYGRLGGGLFGGIVGGILATIAIFLPSFVFTALFRKAFDRMRANVHWRAALNGMNAAVVSLITVTALRWAGMVIQKPTDIVIGLLSLTVLLLTSINATWIVVTACLIGVLVR